MTGGLGVVGVRVVLIGRSRVLPLMPILDAV